MSGTAASVIQAVLLIVFPAVTLWAARRYRVVAWAGPVVVCYLAGIVAANLPFVPVDKKLSTAFSEMTVILAIPLLLFSTDFIAWLKLAPKTILAFAIACLSVTIASIAAAKLFAADVPRPEAIAGMLIGVYTGGTPNMSAIGLALDVPSDLFVLLNAADVLVSSLYLLFLMTFAQPLLRKFLPSFQFADAGMQTGTLPDAADATPPQHPQWRAIGIACLLSAMIAGASVGLSMLTTGKMSVAIIMLSASTFAVAGSFVPRIRRIEGTYATGEYLLFIFCVSIGTMANLSEIIAASGSVLKFAAFVVSVTILINFTLAAILRIDADTTIITSTAAVFGPAFIGPVAGALKNREIVVSGITTGLVGYAIGTYLGLAVAYWLAP